MKNLARQLSGKKINIMKNKAPIVPLLLGLILLHASIFAKTNEWETEKTKDGKVTVKSRISERTDEEGDAALLIEYTATTTASVSMQNCISVINDVSKHKEFTDDEISEIVNAISDNEWVVYYYTNSPSPVPDNDCVSIMRFTEDTTKSTATFTLTAAPTQFEMKDVKRMTYYNMLYAFKDLGDNKVEMTVTGKLTPVVQFPAWMMSAWFPEGPADILRIITKLAKSN